MYRILCLPQRAMLLLLLIVLQKYTLVIGEGETRQIFDDMARFWGRNEGYPDSYYDELVTCFQRWNEPVLQAQDASFRQFYDLWVTGGVNNDTKWGNLEPNWLERVNNGSAFYGGHPESIGDDTVGNVPYRIEESCNYVSNVAWYNSAIRVCRRSDEGNWNIPDAIQSAIMKSIVTTGMSSCGYHGSATELFGAWDSQMSGVATYNAYRIMIQSVDTNSTLFLTTTNNSFAPTGIVELTNTATFFPLNDSLPLEEWLGVVRNLPTPNTFQAGAGLIAFSCAVILPFGICERIVTQLSQQLLNERDRDFFLNGYLPELQMVAREEDLPLPLRQALSLAPKIAAVGVSYAWAFAFQENTIPTPGLQGPLFNTTCLGAFSSPVVDVLLGALTGVDNPTKAIYNEEDEEYPGAKFCNKDSPHALWHQLSADATFELAVVADEMNKILQDRKDRRKSGLLGSVVSGIQNLRGSLWGH